MKLFPLLFALISCSAFAQEISLRSIFTVEDKHYALGPTQMVASGGDFVSLEFSPNGRYLLYTRTVPVQDQRKLIARVLSGKADKQKIDKEIEVALWDDLNRKSWLILRGPDTEVSPIAATWLDSRLFCRDQRGWREIDPATGHDTRFPTELNGCVPYAVVPSRNSIVFIPVEGKTYFEYGPRGAIAFPQPEQGWHYAILNPQKTGMLLRASGSRPKTEAERLLTWMVFDFATQKFRSATVADITFPKEADSDVPDWLIRTRAGEIHVDRPFDQIPTMIGATPKPAPPAQVLNSPEHERVMMTEDQTKFAFVDYNTLFIADIFPVNSDIYEKKVVRDALLSNVKQIGLGMMLYASSFDDVLPPNEDWQNSIMPFIKNSDLMKGFVFSYIGDRKLNSIENPATTILGYIEGPGGRAVVFADSHAEWIDDRKKAWVISPVALRQRPRLE